MTKEEEMKHLKALNVAAVLAGALMAFIGASSASATVLCSTTADPCPVGQTVPASTGIDFSLSSGTSANLQATAEDGGGTLDTCKSSTVKGKLTNAGSSTANATGEITELTWGACTFATTTVLKGGFEVKKIAGTSNGTVIADGETRVTMNTVFFGHCTFALVSGQSVGDITEGKPAVFHANAVLHTVSGSQSVCLTTSVWSATYTMTEPTNTTISVSNG
jgi:hypothetical protein